MFAFGGIKYARETNVASRNSIARFSTKTSDFTVDYGFGVDIFKEYFKTSPEIHFSHGIINSAMPLLPRDNALSYVDKLRTHTVSFILAF